MESATEKPVILGVRIGVWPKDSGSQNKLFRRPCLVVRELESAGRGIPIEIYVFSNDNRWKHYERLQAEIFDHVIAVLPEFDLRLFQEPTGEDLRLLRSTEDEPKGEA